MHILTAVGARGGEQRSSEAQGVQECGHKQDVDGRNGLPTDPGHNSKRTLTQGDHLWTVALASTCIQLVPHVRGL